MLIPISDISVNAGRRDAVSKDIQELADSISKIGLLHPITVDSRHTLIAGLHRLEAAKLLGWTEIECIVSNLDGPQAELVELDENFVRADLSPIDYGDLLLRRKEIYEALHPEAKNGGDRRSENFRTKNFRSDSVKSFAQDAAQKLGVTPRTIELQVQAAKNLTAAAKTILKGTDTRMTKMDAMKLSRLSPEQQSEAASQFVAGEIHSIAQYQPSPAALEPETAPPLPVVPYSYPGKYFASREESIADLKNPNKDCRYTPDLLLSDMDSFINKFHKEVAWYSDPFCTVVFPDISPVQLAYLRQRFKTISDATNDILKQIQKSRKRRS